MPDLLSDDETRTAFAEFRSSALLDVRPPGPAAARRTRHRRAVASAAVGVTVVAVGGGVATTLGGGDPARPVTPAAAPSTGTATASTPVTLRPAVRDDTLVLTQTNVPAGRRQLVVLCSGTGSGEATLAGGGVTTTAPVTCGTPPASSEIEIELPKAAELSLHIAWAPGHRLRDTAEGWALAVWGPE